MNPYVLMAAGAFLLFVTGGSYFKGRHDMAAVYAQKMVIAEQQARKREEELQDAANEITRQYNVDRTRISTDLVNALERLRQRAPRRGVSEVASPTCNGSDGRALSAEDAGFLTREASRADELAAALDACQGWAKEVTTPH